MAREKHCAALKMFKAGRFNFCMHCIHFFKTGSRCTCTGHTKEVRFNLAKDEMFYCPIYGKIERIAKQRSKKPCQKDS